MVDGSCGENTFYVIGSTSLALLISLISHTLELPLLALIAMPYQHHPR
jgi:hypothetical protein